MRDKHGVMLVPKSPRCQTCGGETAPFDAIKTIGTQAIIPLYLIIDNFA